MDYLKEEIQFLIYFIFGIKKLYFIFNYCRDLTDVCLGDFIKVNNQAFNYIRDFVEKIRKDLSDL